MKNYLFIFTLLLMSGCGGAQKSTKDTMAEILKIAHQDSVLNYKDYQTITTLHEQNQAELIALIQDDSSLLFNAAGNLSPEGIPESSRSAVCGRPDRPVRNA